MRSYGQRCGLAKALDVVGDRWALLVVRELLIREAARYSDLRAALPGVATNLLADRLRELEAAGVVERQDAPPPVSATVYRLTERGSALEPALLLLGQWGAARLADADPAEPLQPHWLVLPLRAHLIDRRPDEPAVAVELRSGRERIAVRAAGGGAVDVRLGALSEPAAVVEAEPDVLLRLMTGRTGLAGARAEGAIVYGATAALARLGVRG
jgi:DNA-binding HxlR family transcriptional regulator